jgi:hypothetical protein
MATMSDEESARDWAASGKAYEREAQRRDREQSRQYREGAAAQRQASSSPPAPSRRSGPSIPSGRPQRTIFGTMAFAVLWALIGTEIGVAKGTQPAGVTDTVVSGTAPTGGPTTTVTGAAPKPGVNVNPSTGTGI